MTDVVNMEVDNPIIMINTPLSNIDNFKSELNSIIVELSKKKLEIIKNPRIKHYRREKKY
tara:strand:+ start:1206 stop:1385 length:180 start_codon:yes stop_codon:yes gene_type:complete